MPTISTAKLTVRQFFMLGEDPPGVRLELVDGEIAVSPSPRPNHSFVDRILTFYLLQHILQHDLGMLLGDVDTIFGEYDVRRPDLIYYQKSRIRLIKNAPLEEPPDMCAEIISPSSGSIDRKDKFEQYALGGVPFYWIIDPQFKTIEAYELIDGHYKLCGRGEKEQSISLAPFPDLLIPLGKIWFPSTGD